MGLTVHTKQQEAWGHHVERWHNCVRCELGHHCRKHVLGRGELPCDILFVGEAPDEEDDRKGEPLVGRLGVYINRLIDRAERRCDFTQAVTTTIACLPSKFHDLRYPLPNEIDTCVPRFVDFVGMAEPKGIVLLGAAVETTWLNVIQLDKYKALQRIRTHRIPHPDFLFRNGSTDPKKKIYYADAIKFLRLFITEVTTESSSERSSKSIRRRR